MSLISYGYAIIIIYLFLSPVSCSPPSPLANGSISEYSSGAVGAMLTFQCDTGYMPQEEVTSTCLSNRSWVPTPECQGTYFLIAVVMSALLLI